MTELYIFSQDDDLLTIITEDTGLVSAPVRIEVNSVPDTPFSFTVEADAENAKFVKEENKAVYRDHEGDLRLVVIKELDDSDSMEGPLTTATCEPEFMELAETFVLDRRFTDRTAQFALDAALEHTGWIGEVEVELGLASTNFYRLRVIDSIWEIISTWGGEFKDIVEFDEENNIVTRKIKIKQRLGSDIGQRFEIDHNITEIGRTVLSYPVTAMYGWGASLETDGGGHTRYIDFADVEWKKGVNGAPVDKPKGQKWVGDPEAFEKYKRFRGDKWIHRYGEFSNQDYEDPEELLWATWQNLQENKQPEVNYRLSVDLFDDKVSLGDTAIAIDRYFSRPIEIQARIVAMEYDLMDIDGTMVVEMGQLLNLDDDRINDLERDVEKLKNQRPSNRVTEDSYPDIKPGTPVNVEAYGGMEVIQLYWDYLDEIYIKHYEVYGSQVADFIPDSQHLLYRGRVSAFAHAVNTDETWYYYIRAVNYHGTAGDWSSRADASTHRVLSDDILFGEELADRLRELSETAQIIADGTVDFSHLDNSIIEGNRIRGDLIAVDGTSYIAEGVIGTAAIADGAIENFHLGRGIIGEAQIEDLAVTNAKIASLDADKVNAANLAAITANLGSVTGGKITQQSSGRRLEMWNGEIESYYNNNLSMKFGGFSLDFYNRNQTLLGQVVPLINDNNSTYEGLGLIVENDFFTVGMRQGGFIRPVLRSSFYDNVTTLSGPYRNANAGASLRLFGNRRLVSEDRFSAFDQPAIILDQSDTTNDVDVYFGGFGRRVDASTYFRHRSSDSVSSLKMRIAPSYVRIYDELRVGSANNPSGIYPYSNSIQWRYDINNYIRQQDNGRVEFYSANNMRHSFDSSGNATHNGALDLGGALRVPSAYDNTTSNSANLHIFSGTGRLARSTSARKYKSDIQLATDVDYERILDLNVKSWYDKGEVERNNGSTEGLTRFYGLIANEFEEYGISQMAVYENGEIENYSDRAWTLLIPNIRDVKDDVAWLKTENQLLRNRIKILEEKVA